MEIRAEMCAGAHAKYGLSSFRAASLTETVRNISVECTDINVYECPFGASEVVCTQTGRRTARLISTGAQQGYEPRPKTEFLPHCKHPRSSNTRTR